MVVIDRRHGHSRVESSRSLAHVDGGGHSRSQKHKGSMVAVTVAVPAVMASAGIRCSPIQVAVAIDSRTVAVAVAAKRT